MKLQAISPNFKQTISAPEQKPKTSILNRFQDNIKNTADMNDTLVVPRTIFKGYLGIMTGTSLITLGSLALTKFRKTGLAMTTAGVLSSLYGTYAFVRPYVIKDAPGVLHKKPETDVTVPIDNKAENKIQEKEVVENK